MNIQTPAVPAPVGFNIVGYVSANVGVAVIARHYIRLLLGAGYDVSILDMDPGLGRAGHDAEFITYTVGTAEELRYDVTLVFLFIPDYPQFVLNPPKGLRRTDRTMVAFVWWELTVLPKLWIEALQMFDVVVAGSPFVRHTLESNLSRVPIVYAAPPLFLPDVAADRPHFDLPAGVVFLSSFEPHSDPERKNPFAVLDAFKKAFPDNEDACLLVKLNNARTEGAISPRALIDAIMTRCNNDPRVRVFVDTLSYVDTMRLYASCDVFVSLHRAEGLALGPMEAMSLGKPVIATGWSGNMAFMDQTNSCLVGYTLIPVKGAHFLYSSKFMKTPCSWADPNVEDAARWMRVLAFDPGARQSIGANAAESMRRFQSDARGGHFLAELAIIYRQLKERGHPVPITESALQRLRDLQFLHWATPRQRVTAAIEEFLGRHILWRFRRWRRT